MNIKNLRKNYDRLSRRERLILFDSAENRNDESEMNTVINASPKSTWTICDIVEQIEHLQTLRLIRLAQRLKHCSEAFFWLLLAEQNNNDDFAHKSARLAAYFYCVSQAVDETIYQELGLDAKTYEKKESELFNLESINVFFEDKMRMIAFEENEVEEFIKEVANERGWKIDRIEIGFTYEKELAQLRKILKEKGFSDILKS